MKGKGMHPLVMVYVGMAGALASLLALFYIELRPIDLAWCLPLLGLSALLIFRGGKRLKKK